MYQMLPIVRTVPSSRPSERHMQPPDSGLFTTCCCCSGTVTVVDVNPCSGCYRPVRLWARHLNILWSVSSSTKTWTPIRFYKTGCCKYLMSNKWETVCPGLSQSRHVKSVNLLLLPPSLLSPFSLSFPSFLYMHLACFSSAPLLFILSFPLLLFYFILSYFGDVRTVKGSVTCLEEGRKDISDNRRHERNIQEEHLMQTLNFE